ncbi:hypothetical protein BC830DRAFT_1203465 [Chytriomyces sp. MP71]|nr:hypothetical protein BC830DRAFT_1203465 [Chytriomyces sp. MP71]
MPLGSTTAARMQAGTDSQLDHLQSQHLWLARHACAVPATAIATCCAIRVSATAGGPLHVTRGQRDSPVTLAHPEPRPPPFPQPHQPRVHQQQLQPKPAPAKNKPWGKQPRMSYVAAMAADKAAIANQIIGIHNGDMAPQLQCEPVTYKSLYVNSYFVNHGTFRANPYSGLKQYLYGKGVLQTIWEVSFVGKGWTLAEVFIAEKDWVQVVEVAVSTSSCARRI